MGIGRVARPTCRRQGTWPAVVAFGQAGVDFVAADGAARVRDSRFFAKSPGGTPANVAVGLARLGISVAFMGKLANDELGQFLLETLKGYGVDVTPVIMSSRGHTTIGLAAQDSTPIIYDLDAAEVQISWREVDRSYLTGCRIFHFGSLTLRRQPARHTTWRAVAFARRVGAVISFDPNYRPDLWPNKQEAVSLLRRAAGQSDLVKLSWEELSLVTQGSNDAESFRREFMDPEHSLLIVTKGPDGCDYYGPGYEGSCPGFKVNAVDTTGAGDGFVAGLLRVLLREMAGSSFREVICRPVVVREALEFANAAGAITTTGLGAMSSLPEESQVLALIQGKSGSS